MISEIKELADKMYQREAEIINEKVKNERKQAIEDASRRGLIRSGAPLGKFLEIELNKVKQLSNARMNIDIELFLKKNRTITKSDVEWIYNRTKNLIETQIGHLKRQMVEDYAHFLPGRSISSAVLQKIEDAKTKLMLEIKREVDIRKGQIDLESKKEREVKEISPVSKLSSIKNWTMNHPLVACLVAIIAGVIVLVIGYIFKIR